MLCLASSVLGHLEKNVISIETLELYDLTERLYVKTIKL